MQKKTPSFVSNIFGWSSVNLKLGSFKLILIHGTTHHLRLPNWQITSRIEQWSKPEPYWHLTANGLSRFFFVTKASNSLPFITWYQSSLQNSKSINLYKSYQPKTFINFHLPPYFRLGFLWLNGRSRWRPWWLPDRGSVGGSFDALHQIPPATWGDHAEMIGISYSWLVGGWVSTHPEKYAPVNKWLRFFSSPWRGEHVKHIWVATIQSDVLLKRSEYII